MRKLFPRFRGIAIEVDGQWTWEMLISLVGQGDEGSVFTTKDRFKTKAEAIAALKEAIQFAIKALPPELKCSHDLFIDMKTNETRRWDKKDEQ